MECFFPFFFFSLSMVSEVVFSKANSIAILLAKI